MEGGKKTAERLQAVTADAKRGWQNVEQIFMDHERKSEKKITNKKNQGLVPTTGTDCSR